MLVVISWSLLSLLLHSPFHSLTTWKVIVSSFVLMEKVVYIRQLQICSCTIKRRMFTRKQPLVHEEELTRGMLMKSNLLFMRQHASRGATSLPWECASKGNAHDAAFHSRGATFLLMRSNISLTRSILHGFMNWQLYYWKQCRMAISSIYQVIIYGSPK